MIDKYVTLVEREETPLWVALVIEGGADKGLFERTHAIEFQLEKYRFIGRISQIGAKDLERLQSVLEQKTNSEGFAYFKWYEDTCREYCLKLLETARELSTLPLPAPKSELSSRLHQYFIVAHNCMPFMISIFPLQVLLAERLGKAIKPILDETNLTLDSALALLSRPASLTSTEQDSRRLDQLVEEVLADSQLRALLQENDAESLISKVKPQFYDRLEQHCKDFGWLRTFTYRNKPYGVQDLVMRLRDRVWRCERFLGREQKDTSATDSIMQQLSLIETKLDDEGNKSLELARHYATLRFYRVDVHFISAAQLSGLFGYGARALGLPFELFAYLTHSEIIQGLSGRKLPWLEIAQARKKDGFNVVLGPEGRAIVSTPTSMEIPSEPGQAIIEGTSACLGKATGRVRVIRNAEECAEFDRGDILVSPMTTPEFMAAIDRAGGIVTDEGGLLCHAAIISRELGIPCVIGTQTASHVLRTGELVTVNALAEKGTVHRNEF